MGCHEKDCTTPRPLSILNRVDSVSSAVSQKCLFEPRGMRRCLLLYDLLGLCLPKAYFFIF